MNYPSETDVLIVGGGVVGLCSAYFLLQESTNVMVLDRQQMWSDSSGANAGTVAVQNKIKELQPMTMLSIELWKQTQNERNLDLGYKQTGGIRVALGEQQLDQLKKDWLANRNNGMELQWLQGRNLQEFTPWIGDDVDAAIYCPFDSQSIPLSVGPALKSEIKKLGGLLCDGINVTGIRSDGESVFVSTETAGEIRCQQVIIAAGSWTRELALKLGFELPVAIDVNMLSVTERVDKLVDNVVTHVLGVLSLKQYPNGTCIIGGGWQGHGSLETNSKNIDYENLLHNLKLASKVVPALKDVRLVRSWAGFEPVMSDALPCLGRLPDYKNVWIAAGARGGYSLGPAQGKLMSEMILGKPSSLESIKLFDPGRFK